MTSIDIQTLPTADLSAPPFDLEKAEKDGKSLLFNNFFNGKKPLVIKFAGSLCTNGVNVSKFGENETNSIGVLLDETAMTGFNALQELVENYLVEKNLDDKIEVLSPLKDDKIYIKLRYDGKNKKWGFKSNVPINPTTPQSANLFKGQDVTIVASCSGYLNTESKKVGIYITPQNLTFSK